MLAFLLGSSSAAHADDKMDCATAHFEGQNLRDAGQFTKAHERFLSCTRDRCPRAIQEECAGFLAEIERIRPSMVIEAIDEHGSTILDVRVSVDGVPLADRLTGLSMNVDPGEHVLRLTLRDGTAKEQRIVMLAGDHAKRIRVRFDGAPPAKPAGAASSTEQSKGVPTSAWILGGVGAATLVSGVAFGAMALSDHSGFDACGATRTCDSGDVRSMHTKALVADISFAVAAGAAIAAVVLVLTNGHETPHAAAHLAHAIGAPVSF
ncbi:hypothetical protein AKJ09_08193 [Labilithrix luteola]|uniref:PEGA domain-containing protein n=1 Tax=Labilithrix luteola TaxID=1391654 RepID=A0A0K1Q7Z4_9BACT|nr:hypothetical protein AKJ09_08193 [Labilithrix luteola]